MRVAVLADIHGNLISMQTVVRDIESQPVDHVVSLGDVAGLGPQPREVLTLLREIDPISVMGNADEFLLDPQRLDPARHPDATEHLQRMHDIERWCADLLTHGDRSYIGTFQSTVALDLGEGIGFLGYHGSPRAIDEEIRGSTPDDRLRETLDGDRPMVMAGGHTHEQFLRRLDQSIVINPGSVGLPYETLEDGSNRNPPWAEYAVVEVQGGSLHVDLRRVEVDQEAIRAAVISSGMPHAGWWAADWR